MSHTHSFHSSWNKKCYVLQAPATKDTIISGYEAMNLENSVSDIETCTVEKVSVVFKWEAGKDVKTDTNTQMKQYPIQDLRWI